MIIKGNARGNAKWLADHLARTDTNEVAEVLEIRGVVSRTPLGAFREIAATALCTKARDPLYHANIDPPADEKLTAEQWARAVDALEDRLGFKDQPRVVVRHLKEGREHVHVVWSRIDIENRRAIPDSHNFRKHEEVARALEREFGHARVQGAHVEREEAERPARTPSRAEMQQAERTGIDPKAVKAEVSGLWQQTDNGKAFAAALDEAGYCLARGDRRDFIIIDQAGEVHSLARRVEGARAADIRARMADLDPAGLPDAEQAKAMQAARALARGDQAGRGAAEPGAVPLAEPAARPEAATVEAEAPTGKAPRPKRTRTRAKASRDAAEDAGADQAPQAEPPPASPAEQPAPVVQQIDPAEAIQPEAGRIDQPALDAAEAAEPQLETEAEAQATPDLPAPLEAQQRAEVPAAPEADPTPDAAPEAAPASGSIIDALTAARRHLLDVLRRVFTRRSELEEARAPAAPAPVEAEAQPAPTEQEQRRQQFLDVLKGARAAASPPTPPVLEADAERSRYPEDHSPKPEAKPVAEVDSERPRNPDKQAPAPAIEPIAAPEPEAPELPAIIADAQRRQAAEAEREEAEAKRRRQEDEQRKREEDEERRRRDPRIRQEEAQLLSRQARQDSTERKALQEKQSVEWRRLEKTEATRAKRDSIEEDQIARAEADEDEARQPRGLLGKLKGLLSPAAAREREEEQRRIEAQRIRDHADRLAQRRERDTDARRMLTEAQAREKATAEKAREARRARELEELRQRQRDREERERQREREARERGGGRGDDGGREM
jgi:hypothetical protein